MSFPLNIILIVFVLTCIALLLFCINKEHHKRKDLLSVSNREDHFDFLISKITPAFYWRVHNEYDDFINATIKKMTVDEIISQRELFDAQRRCSDLNSAVYRYYENIKKRCANGEEIAISDIEVINLRQCFNELSCQAYPELVALIWPQYQCPTIKREDIMNMTDELQPEIKNSNHEAVS